MKTKIIFLTLTSFILSIGLYAQTKTNIEALNQLSDEFSKEWTLQQERVTDYAALNNVQVRVESEDGRIVQMVDVQDGKPVYISTTNLGAAHTTRAFELWAGGSTGLGLSGEEYDKLGEWDGGKVRVAHQEFTNGGPSRVTQMDNTSGISNHATHVAGTMVAGGVVANAKGMAYEGKLKAWDWDNDLSEMSSAGQNGLEISNHSYSFFTGWVYDNGWTWYGNANVDANEDYRFGFYSLKCRSVDIVSYNAPNYLVAVAAANDRGSGPPDAGTGGQPEVNGGTDGYDCLPEGYSNAKNVLTVGAVKEVLDYTGPGDVYMSSFSGWGPTDDGRIKPDVVAKGVDVYSSIGSSNTSYASYDGTSMATPNTAGTLALLQQHYQNLNEGTPMRSATLKGLVIHSADETGPDPGPDYMFGWGLVNAERASQIITDDQGQNVIDELELQENDSYTREINVPEGVNELRVTLCWTDYGGLPVGAQLNPPDPMIVSDLDLSITDEGNTTYYPYKLDPLNPSAPPTTDSKNYVDNVEMVFIAAPAAGTWTIHIDHEGELYLNAQAYSLIITGIDEYTEVPECTAGLSNPLDGGQNVLPGAFITWYPAPLASTYNVYFGTDGGGTTTPTNALNGENVSTNGFSYPMDVNTTYYLQVVPMNSMGIAEGCEEIWSFTTMAAISEFPYVEDVESVESGEVPDSWLTLDYSEIQWLSTGLTSNGGDFAMGCYNMDGLIETEMNNWFVSPPFLLEGGKAYPVSFYYRNFIPNHAESLSVFWGNSPDPSGLSNTLYEAADFTGSGWNLAETNLVSGGAGVYFIGWYAESPTGYGIFLDDITVGAGTSVNIEESPWDVARIFSSNGNIRVEADETWAGADLVVVNLVGQVVYQGKYFQPETFSLNRTEGTGMYFATLRKGEHVFTKKIVLSKN